MKHKAFTLLEILIVLAIICILLSILIPRCNQELEPTPSVPVYPSESDDRQEIIFIAAKGIGGNSLLQHMPVKRDKDGRIIERAFIARSEGESQTYLLDCFYAGFFGGLKEFQARR